MVPVLARVRAALLAATFVIATPAVVLAHHGWSWTEDEESRLSGTIESISLGNPHAQISLRTEEGVWRVDLAPPAATARAGFIEGVVRIGDEAVVTGHRSRDSNELAFKAETITVNGKTYDVYPSREKTLQPAG
jgi:hypothetical protein